MSHDPWNHFPDLSCPECHVLGKVVRCEDDEWSDEVVPYVCADCGHAFADVGMVGDLKPYRTEYMRMVEGRPYEAPRPKEPEYTAQPLDLSKLKKTSSAWPPFVIATEYVATAPSDSIGYALSMDTWSLPEGTVTVTPIFGADQHPHHFTCSMWQWPPGACSCGAGDE